MLSCAYHQASIFLDGSLAKHPRVSHQSLASARTLPAMCFVALVHFRVHRKLRVLWTYRHLYIHLPKKIFKLLLHYLSSGSPARTTPRDTTGKGLVFFTVVLWRVTVAQRPCKQSVGNSNTAFNSSRSQTHPGNKQTILLSNRSLAILCHPLAAILTVSL